MAHNIRSLKKLIGLQQLAVAQAELSVGEARNQIAILAAKNDELSDMQDKQYAEGTFLINPELIVARQSKIVKDIRTQEIRLSEALPELFRAQKRVEFLNRKLKVAKNEQERQTMLELIEEVVSQRVALPQTDDE